jgi:hypothetical protein
MSYVMLRRLGFESFSLFSKSPQMPAYQTILTLETHTCNNKIVLWTSHNYHWNLRRSTLLWLLPEEQNNRNCIVFLVCHVTWLSTLVLIRHKLNSQTCPLQSGTMTDNNLSWICWSLQKSLWENKTFIHPQNKVWIWYRNHSNCQLSEGAS